MKTTKKSIILAAALSLVFSASAAAHTGHDHSELPLKWHFTKNTQAKVISTMHATSGKVITGLSKFEQKKLDRYGIRVGASFKSTVANHPVLVKRTTTGLEILGVRPFDLTSVWQIPLRKINEISLTSTGAGQHAGHDHSVKPYEWEFSERAQDRISRRLPANHTESSFVGLPEFEQKLMERYGFQIGNKFFSNINGQNVRVERTSGGIRVQAAGGNPTLAKASEPSRM